MSPFIRSELPFDASAIGVVTATAFLDAAHTEHTEQFIIEALRKAGALALSLVAEERGKIVGHVAVSPVSISDGSMGWYGIGPLSVQPDHQRHGIGSFLMHEALRCLQERGAAGCVVLGEPAYYSRFGFKPAPDLVLPDVPPEYFQALSFGSAVATGTVMYHPAFGTRE